MKFLEQRSHSRTSLCLWLIVGLTLASCQTEWGSEAPTIEIVSLSPESALITACNGDRIDALTLGSGDSLRMNMIFRDDEGLFQLQTDLHPNFDCHSHDELDEGFNQTDELDIVGTEYRYEEAVQVPDDVIAGPYHLWLRVVDMDGNTSLPPTILNLQLYNRADSISPQLRVAAPQFSNLTVAVGSSIRFAGEVEDNVFLGAGDFGRLLLTLQEEGSERRQEAFELRWLGTENLIEPFDFRYEIPESLSEGSYMFVLVAYDALNNESVKWEYEVEVSL